MGRVEGTGPEPAREEGIGHKYLSWLGRGQDLWHRVHPGLRYALGVYLVARVATSAWAALVLGVAPVHHPGESESGFYQTVFNTAYPHKGPLADLVLGAWYRWDTTWYITVATQGYSAAPEAVVFPPLYPLLIRYLGQLVGRQYLLAALIISNAAYFGSLYMLYRMVEARFSVPLARRSLVWLALFPAAFYYLAGYNESLFLLLTLLTLSAAEDRRWCLAGASLYLATLTRWNGVVLTVPLLYEMLHGGDGKLRPLQPKQWYHSLVQLRAGALAVSAAPLAIGTQFLYLYLTDVIPPTYAYPRMWHSRIAWPWVSIAEAVPFLLGTDIHPTEGIGLIMLAFFLVLTLMAMRRLRPSWWLFALISQIFFLSRVQGLRPLEGTLRYLAVLFPIFVFLALRLKNGWISAGLQVVFVMLQLLLLAVFIRWGWVA